MIKVYLSKFITAWVIILFLNQAVIFGCFAPYCILAGMPHTAFLAFLYVYFFVSPNKEGTDIDSPIEKTLNKTEKSIEKVSDNLDTVLDDLDESMDRIKEEFETDRLIANAKREVERKQAKEKAQKIRDGIKKDGDKTDFLKQKGDAYEKFIGFEFEKKGDFVIYNGLIRGYDDDGVDVIAISTKESTIHLIQCKNWTKKPMMLSDVENIYAKLKNFNLGRITKNAHIVHNYSQGTKTLTEIENILKANKKNFNIRKTLYVGSDKVIDLNIGKQLTLITPIIFRYLDMKIVIKRNSSK